MIKKNNVKRMRKLGLFCLLAISVFSCNVLHKNKEQASTTKSNAAHEEKANPFFAYNFGGLEKLTPAEQIATLKKHGYDGITLRMAKAEHVAEYLEFAKIVDKTEDFKIYSVFIRYNFADSEEDRNRWKVVVDLIENQGIDLWVIFGKNEPGIDDAHVEGVLRNMTTYAASKNVPVTLYPHSWCYFYTTEQSLPMVKKINHPNLKLALHTCHELKAGNAGRLAEVVENAEGYISFVTIAGAKKEIDMTKRRTMDRTSILPLEDSEYKGPVGYINFGFPRGPEEYLAASLEEWNRLKNNYLQY